MTLESIVHRFESILVIIASGDCHETICLPSRSTSRKNEVLGLNTLLLNVLKEWGKQLLFEKQRDKPEESESKLGSDRIKLRLIVLSSFARGPSTVDALL